MSSPLECSVCLNPFNFDTERRAMSLSCGHTLCRGCIVRMSTKQCPSCRVPFTSGGGFPVPNYTIRDIMTAAATTHEVQPRKEIEAHFKAVTALVAAMQLECKERDAAIASEQEKSIAAHEDLRQLSLSLLPITQALEPTPPTPPSDPTNPTSGRPSGRATRARSDWTTDPSQLPPSQRRVVKVTSTDLGELLREMADFPHREKTFDFQGLQMQYDEPGDPTIVTRSVTWRNGSVLLRSVPKQRESDTHTQSLVIKGAHVVLEGVKVTGGHVGVRVAPGGGLTMTGCEVSDVGIGVQLEGSGSLVANDLRVLNCSLEGFKLVGSSTAIVNNCEVSGSMSQTLSKGIDMRDTSSMQGTGMRISGIRNSVLYLQGGARLALTGCTMRANPGKPGSVFEQASLMLSCCTMDGEVETSGARICIKG